VVLIDSLSGGALSAATARGRPRSLARTDRRHQYARSRAGRWSGSL